MNKEFKFLDAYAPIFYEDKTYWVISGGRASGKSTNVAAYFIVKLISPDYFRGVIARYTQKALTNSIYRDIVDLINNWGLQQDIHIKGDEILNIRNGNLIITHSMKLQEGIMTARGKGLARVTHLLIDEATELPSEEEYIKLIDSFREKNVDRKIFLLFNPTSKSHWIFRRFYNLDGSPNTKWLKTHGFIHTTYHDNIGNLDPKKIQEWEWAAQTDPEYYNHHILGQWKDVGAGQIFKNWIFSYYPDPESETLYGIDLGFSGDPTAVIEVKKRGKRLWLKELIYQTGLTNDDLSRILELKGISKTASIYVDSAEPRSIEELRRLGWRNVRPAIKGPDSVKSGIRKIQEYEVFVDPESKNLAHEYEFYSYRENTDKPIDAHNHLMDACRYALSTHKSGPTIGLPSQKLNWKTY